MSRWSRATSGVVRLTGKARPSVVVWLLTFGSLYLAFRHALPCGDRTLTDDEAWKYACYNDIQPLYSGRLLSQGAVPYLHHEATATDHNVEYPVLIGAFMAVVGLPIHALFASGKLATIVQAVGFAYAGQGLVFYWVTLAGLGGLALLATWGLLSCRRERPWDVLRWAMAPALVLHSTINWDMLAVAMTVLALLAWSRRKPVMAGVLFGLGVATKLYPLVVLGPLVLLCLRAGTRTAKCAAARLLAAATLSWVVVNLPVFLLNREGWAYPYSYSTTRWLDWGSAWWSLREIFVSLGYGEQIDDLIGTSRGVNVVSLLLFAASCIGIAALVWFAPRPPRVAAAALLVVGAFLLTNKVWSPQFVLWILPLVVLARPRWGWFLVWQAAEVMYLFAVFRAVLADQDRYALEQASIIRWVSVASLCGLVVIEALHPERDVVRTGGLDDPDGGILSSRSPAARAEPGPSRS